MVPAIAGQPAAHRERPQRTFGQQVSRTLLALRCIDPRIAYAMAIDIPDYRVIQKLGEGAQSRLYRARCLRTGKDYTIKLVKVTRPEDTGFVDLMRSEHAIGSTIDHPVIRKVYELRILRQRLRVRGAILFMEYVEGVAMSEKEFRQPLATVLQLFTTAAEGLHAMHMAGYVHADLKPNNIIFTTDGKVKIIDLGQSSKIHESKTRIQGTIDYIAPEQVQRGVLDQRTDVFGLGAALHRVVTGQPVATEMNQTVSVHSQGLIGKRVDELRHPADVSLPICVAKVIDDCCQNDPSARIADMPTLIERFRLAHAVLQRQTGEEPAIELDETMSQAESSEPQSLHDSILEELGLVGERDDSVDLDIIPDPE